MHLQSASQPRLSAWQLTQQHGQRGTLLADRGCEDRPPDDPCRHSKQPPVMSQQGRSLACRPRGLSLPPNCLHINALLRLQRSPVLLVVSSRQFMPSDCTEPLLSLNQIRHAI